MPYALVAYRVYRTNNCPVSYIGGNWINNARDDYGRRYLGFSRRNDEWLPLYGPRIATHLSKSARIGDCTTRTDIDEKEFPPDMYDAKLLFDEEPREDRESSQNSQVNLK